MPMLKTIGAGTGSCRELAEYLVAGERGDSGRGERLQRYLAGDETASRSLAFGHSENMSCGELDWAEAMRVTRREWHKDSAPAGGSRWRSYYHWAISPAPGDHASADEVAELARRWAEDMWPAADGWQWVYSVHADNAGSIMHAHVVLNAVNDLTGRKVQIGRRRSDELADHLQELAGEYGMGRLPKIAERRRALKAGLDPAEGTEWSRMSAAERAMRKSGRRSWVAEVRDEVDRAVRECGDFEQFKERLEHDGFKVEYSRRGIGFRHPESTGSDKKVLGSRLGTDYTDEGLRARLTFSFDEHLLDAPLNSGRVGRRGGLPGLKPSPVRVRTAVDARDWLKSQIALGPRRRSADIEAAAAALRFVKDGGVRSASQLTRIVESARAEAMGLEREALLIEDGLAAAIRALRAAERAETARAELAALPEGPWDRLTRTRRNDLLETVQKSDDEARRGLGKAQRFLVSRGLGESAPAVQAAELVSELGSMARDAHARSEEARKRLEAAAGVEDTVDRLAGRKARAVRPRSQRRLVDAGGRVEAFKVPAASLRAAVARRSADTRSITRLDLASSATGRPERKAAVGGGRMSPRVAALRGRGGSVQPRPWGDGRDVK